MTADTRRTRGVVPAVGSVVVAGGSGAAIVAPAEHVELSVLLAGLGLLGLAVAIGLRSERIAGAAGLPIFTGAVVHILTADDSIALWALGVGCGWYLATELAWESINRQVECDFEPVTSRRRVEELVGVIAITGLVATAALLVSVLAPPRTVVLEAAVVTVVVAVGATAIRRLTTA